MYNNKATTIPHIKIDHIIENGNFFFVILVLTYNPQTAFPWGYSFYTENGGVSTLRSDAKRYFDADEASREIDRMLELSDEMLYNRHH